MEITGEFETHITIDSNKPERIEALKKWGEINGLKFLHIVLERGFSVSQPMLTRKGCGCFSDEYVKAVNLSKSLTAQGFSVSRIKIEIATTNRSVPQSDSEFLDGVAGRYFESHIKLLIENSVNIELLAKLVEPYSAHLSHSASRFRKDNRHERFITQRC